LPAWLNDITSRPPLYNLGCSNSGRALIVTNLDDQDGVFVVAAQSGVGLNQSVLLANAPIARFAGNARIFDLSFPLSGWPIMIPTIPIARKASLQLGTKA